jgi:hypothetical protein
MAILAPREPIPEDLKPPAAAAKEALGPEQVIDLTHNVGGFAADALKDKPFIVEFDGVDPTQPGTVHFNRTAADSLNPLFSSSPLSETTKESSTMFFRINNPDYRRPEIKSPRNAANSSSSEQDVVNKARQSSAKSHRTLRFIDTIGVVTGAAAVLGACAWVVKSEMAAEAAGAAASTAANTSTISTVMSTMTAAKTIAGVTLPVWGWALGAVAVAAVGYGVYKFTLGSSQDKKTESKREVVNQGVTAMQAVRAFGSGFANGAFNAAGVAGVVLLAGTIGVAVMDKSVNTFGQKYGPVIAIGGTVVGVGMAFAALGATANYFIKKSAERNDHKRTDRVDAPAAAAA